MVAMLAQELAVTYEAMMAEAAAEAAEEVLANALHACAFVLSLGRIRISNLAVTTAHSLVRAFPHFLCMYSL